jgi:hypothetical protein
MELAWMQIVVALIIGASMHSAATGNLEPGNLASDFDINSTISSENTANHGKISIREIAVNPSSYEFEKVTIEGEVQDNLKPVEIGNGGYTVKLYLCEEKYGTDFGYSHSYEITGKVVNPPGNDDGYMIQCTEPPKVNGEAGPLAN